MSVFSWRLRGFPYRLSASLQDMHMHTGQIATHEKCKRKFSMECSCDELVAPLGIMKRESCGSKNYRGSLQ